MNGRRCRIRRRSSAARCYYVFGLAMLLVYLVLAGQYESWYAPISVILAVPLSLLGPMAVLERLKIDNNLYVQIGLMLLDRAVGQERHPDRRGRAASCTQQGKSVVESAVEAGAAPASARS